MILYVIIQYYPRTYQSHPHFAAQILTVLANSRFNWLSYIHQPFINWLIYINQPFMWWSNGQTNNFEP